MLETLKDKDVLLVSLKDAIYIGRGTNRACYVHPNDTTKCIKVTVSKDFNESKKEKKYYEFLQKRNISWQHIAQYYGTVPTDMGEGLVFELIRDENGNVSKRLMEYFSSEEETQNLDEPLKKLLELNQYLLKERVIVKDLGLNNILYQKGPNGKDSLVIIDGVLNNEFIPIATHIDYFTEKKIKSRWKKFIKHFEARIGNNRVLRKMYQITPL